MSESALNGFLDELVKSSLDCIGYMEENEEWKSMARRNNIEGSKKLRLATNSKLEVVEEELRSKEEELKRMEKVLKKVDMNGSKTYVLSDQSEHEVSNELVLKYLGSWIYDNLIDLESRDGKKVDTGYPLKYFDEIVRYMGNEYDIWKLNGVEFVEFCRELMEVKIPFRMDIMKRLWNGFNEDGVRWKNRCVVVNENEYKIMMKYMKEWRLNDLKNNDNSNRFEVIKSTAVLSAVEILNDFENYLKDPPAYVKSEDIKINDIISLFKDTSINTSDELVKEYMLHYTSSLCFGSLILDNTYYDDSLKKWIGDHKWRLVSREENKAIVFETSPFYCMEPILILRVTNGTIFGQFFQQSLNERSIFTALFHYSIDSHMDTFEHETIKLTCSNKEGSSREANTQSLLVKYLLLRITRIMFTKSVSILISYGSILKLKLFRKNL